jgi:hypothetical protein
VNPPEVRKRQKVSEVVGHKNINAAVRTPRCAILINENSAYWRTAASGVIMRASEVWGGRYFLLIPTNGIRIKDKFWELLEAYSPDHIAIYNLSFADIEEAEPVEYAKTKQRYRESWQAKGFGGDFDEWFEKQANVSSLDQVTISETLERQLIARLSPFHFQNRAVRERISHGSGFGFQFTKMSDIISFTTSHIGQVVLPKEIEDPVAALLIHSQTGLASSAYCENLKLQNFATTQLPNNYPTSDFLEHVFGGKDLVVAQASPNDWRPTEDYMSRTPFKVSMLHLGEYYDARFHLGYKEPVVVILGDSVDDFCLYYSLSRLHECVCWLPLKWLRTCYHVHNANYKRYMHGQQLLQLNLQQQLARSLVNLFFQLIEYGHGEKRIELRSMSLNVRQLAAYRKQMIACCLVDAKGFASHTDCVPIERSSTACILRVFEYDNYSNNEPMMFVDRNTVSPFATPRPKNFTEVRPTGHYWLASLRVEDYGPPPLPTLGTEIINIHGLATESRVANDGIAYNCPNISYFGGGIDAVLVRPKIHLPDEMDLLGAYFGSIDVSIQFSDKGNYFLDTLERFGGLDEAGAFIKARRTRSILDKFLSKDNAKGGSVIFLRNDQRAYLSLEAFSSSLGSEEAAAILVDELIGKRILERGYILQCQRCRLVSWYSINVLSSDFICNRCSFLQQFTLGHWRQPTEPHWYYRLVETVYQFYLHNSHLTVQTLFKFKSQSRLAFHYVPEIELLDFPSPGEKRELDIAFIMDGEILLGEGKTGALRPKDAEKFEMLLKRLDKRPDRIIFATALSSVSSEFKARISGLPRSEVLVFGDLYDT